jgi:alkylmercury lyase
VPTAHPTLLSETARGSGETTLMAQHERRLHWSLIDAVLETGSVPPAPVLAARLETSEDDIASELRSLAVADYLALDASGQVACLYPFSTTPTPHVVVIDGRSRYAMCAIDALGIPAMLDRELDVAGRCAVCNAPITLRVRPGTIVAATPPGAMVVARRDEAEPAFAACCPFTVFTCGQEHADHFAHRITSARRLVLAEALAHAETIFANLLAENLPARRPRGKRWLSSDDS